MFPGRGGDPSKGRAPGMDIGGEWTMGSGIRNEAVWTRWPRDATDWESVSFSSLAAFTKFHGIVPASHTHAELRIDTT